MENLGQLPSDVKYYGDMKGGSVFLQEDGLVYSFHTTDSAIADSIKSQISIKHANLGKKKYASYKVKFENAAYPRLKPGTKLNGGTNYYTGNDPAKWAEGVRAFSEVYMPSLYKGIDLKMYSQFDAVKYDFIVSPGAHPSQIALQFSGTDSLWIDSLGGLVIYAGFSREYEYPPYVYQRTKEGEHIIIPSKFVLHDSTVRFEIGKYNTADTLIIDPSLLFSTYTGSRSDNWGSSATYDEQGNAYTSGLTEIGIPGYPVEDGKLQFIHGGGHGYLEWDIGLMKVSSSGENMVYATYFGGNGSDCPHSMVVNSKGELLVFGTTGSSNLPGAINKFSGGKNLSIDGFLDFDNGVDMFVAHFGLNGELKNSIYLGGTDNDGINYHSNMDPNAILTGNDSLYYNYGDWARGEIGIDQSDNIYIGCSTRSTDFPSARNTSSGIMDGIVVKLAPSLLIQWSRYIGGSENDAIYSIDVDQQGTVYATGGTSSKDLSTNFNAYKRTYMGGTTDGFLGKIDTQGNLNALTYFGSSAYDQSYFVRLDKSKSVYIFGQTKAPDSELIFNAAYNKPNSGQFIAKFQNDLSGLVWSTAFGTGNGKPNISPTAFSVDLCNRVYLSGSGREWPRSLSNYQWIPSLAKYQSIIEGTNGMEITSNAYQSETDGIDFYIMVMFDDASALDYATFLGEVRTTNVYFRADALGRVYWDPTNDHCGDDHVDGGTSRFDRRGNVYQSVCASCGGCNGFPIAPKLSAYSTFNGSTNCNNAVAKFNIHNEFLISHFTAYPNPCVEKEVVLRNLSSWINVNNVKFDWDFGNGTTSTEREPTLNYTDFGTYTIRLIATDMSSCNLIDTSYVTVDLRPMTDPELDSLSICAADTVRLGFEGFADTSFKYQWIPTTYLLDSTSPNPRAVVYDNFDYRLIAKSDYCEREFAQSVTVIGGNMQVNIEIVGKDSTVTKFCPGDNIKLLAKSNRKVNSYEWSWTPDFQSRINLSLLDSTLNIRLTENQTLYLRTLGQYCEGIDIDTIDLSLSMPILLTNADAPAVCKNGLTKIWAYEANGDTLNYEWRPNSQIIGRDDLDTVNILLQKPSTFYVNATDKYGCKLESSVFVNVDTVWLGNSTVDSISCNNSGDGSLYVIPAGIQPYLFQWADITESVSVRNQLSSGIYSVTLTDALGCVSDTTFTLNNPPRLTVHIDQRNQSCKDVCNGNINLLIEGGTPPITVLMNDLELSELHIDSLCQQDFSFVLTDANGCETHKSTSILLIEALPYLQAFAIPAELIKGQQAELHAAPEKFISDSTLYIWSPIQDINSPNGATVLATPEATTYFTVIGTDKFGCANTDTLSLHVKDYICGDPFVYVPNAFSPNGDGTNDLFKVQSQVLEQFTILVFNRWGQIVWETSDPNDAWDGTFKGELLSPAVFDFYLHGTCYSKEKIELKGNIHLIR